MPKNRGAKKVIEKGLFAGYRPWIEEGKSIEEMAVERLEKYFRGKRLRVALGKDRRGRKYIEIYEKLHRFADAETVATVYYYQRSRTKFVCSFKTRDPDTQADIHCAIASLFLVT